MDVLTDVLHSLDLKGWLSSRTEMTTSWRFEFAASQDMIFHILTFGGGYLFIEGEREPLRIEDGDVMLFPHGHAHILCDEPASPLTQAVCLNYEAYREHRLFPSENEGTKMVMLCGAFHFDQPGDSPLLHCLPKVIHIPGERGRMEHGFADIVNFIARESISLKTGSEVMLRRLTEMLFIQVIRLWIDQQADAERGWLAALRDQPISMALGLIHQFPEQGWKVEELAEAVALSRSVFSARFTHLVGEPPLKYLTRWRMQKALRLLKNEVKVEKIAQQLGYESEAAFRKAFKREIGIPPARYRKHG
ncbi:AraC family transcriptional regulator [Ktedonobacter racemifer]|uniref:Transcriptional regulator, AraC family n=1 Tax=Ktedonobacter racemifer DSM 44963 TaxID=485913 RepID=D6U3J4_KTERA|nr:AraC family transcriptional regulator [Ktedonobacter racemifer]EFH82984.1 transcriptional regulator, AraC family [Ktedonobacter racemifer DSM 44963]